MSYNLVRIKKEFNELCDKANVPHFDNIIINSRLTSTLGRVMSMNGKPQRVEFSKHFLDNATDDCVWSVIAHECAHYVALYRDKQRHGHDLYFKMICAELGTTNDGTTTDVEKTVASKSYNRYDIYCDNCGQYIGGYQRMTSRLKNLNNCWCSGCGPTAKGKLRLVQNW